MIIFEWDDALNTGIPLIDQQHRQIFRQINAFFIGFKCGQARVSTQKCLEFLAQYVQFHFQSEEAFQVQSAYPNYLSHQARHKALATQVKFFAVRIEKNPNDDALMDEFHRFLTGWMHEHILGEDLAFAAHYRTYTAHEADKPS